MINLFSRKLLNILTLMIADNFRILNLNAILNLSPFSIQITSENYKYSFKSTRLALWSTNRISDENQGTLDLKSQTVKSGKIYLQSSNFFNNFARNTPL